jgi:hypothetical protein
MDIETDGFRVIEERALRVMDWADLNGADLAGVLRLDEESDYELLTLINDALLAAGDAYHLARRLMTIPTAP